MRVTLARRHHGVHWSVRQAEVPGHTSDYVRCRPDEVRGRTYVVNETKLLRVLPRDFLPADPRKILLTVSDGEGGGDAVGEPKIFRTWGKYFVTYSLTLERTRPPSKRTLHRRWGGLG